MVDDAKPPAQAPACAAEAAPADDLVEATVRRGVVFWGAGPYNGKTWVPPPTISGPGETVRIPRAEVDRLIALGALVDPADPASVPLGQRAGPPVEYGDGAIVQQPGLVRITRG
jgi:hypothetical protein